MNHFLEIAQLSRGDIEQLLQQALLFKKTQHYPQYHGSILANLFFESSTRTRVSFELAAKRLGMDVINLDLATSSQNKGETLEDTVKTLSAMGIGLFAVRHRENGLPDRLAKSLPDVHIINAGDGTHAHPSQAMLDLMTIVEKKPRIADLKIVIVGDIRHSRVANSLLHVFKLMEVAHVMLVAPPNWSGEKQIYGDSTSSLAEGLEDADVVIVLRVQHERLSVDEQIDLFMYQQQYRVTQERLSRARPDVVVMHPGPVNRDIEIASDVVDSVQSLILTQVHNGVLMRMAILDAFLRSEQL